MSAPDARYRVIVGLSMLAGIVLPFLGYAYLIGSHGDERPAWVTAVIPFAALGDDDPSIAQFLLLLCGNVILWAGLTYGLLSLVWRAKRAAVDS